MGYIKHHAIVVTSYGELTDICYKKAKEIFGEMVSPVIKSALNRYTSFFIAPDGSKEGWPDSNDGDKRRKEFIGFVNRLAYEDGSSSVSFAELYYGEDNGFAVIENHN